MHIHIHKIQMNLHHPKLRIKHKITKVDKKAVIRKRRKREERNAGKKERKQIKIKNFKT